MAASAASATAPVIDRATIGTTLSEGSPNPRSRGKETQLPKESSALAPTPSKPRLQPQVTQAKPRAKTRAYVWECDTTFWGRDPQMAVGLGTYSSKPVKRDEAFAISRFGAMTLLEVVHRLRATAAGGWIKKQEADALILDAVESYADYAALHAPECLMVDEEADAWARSQGFEDYSEFHDIPNDQVPAQMRAGIDAILESWFVAKDRYIARLYREAGENELADLILTDKSAYESVFSGIGELSEPLFGLSRDHCAVAALRELASDYLGINLDKVQTEGTLGDTSDMDFPSRIWFGVILPDDETPDDRENAYLFELNGFGASGHIHAYVPYSDVKGSTFDRLITLLNHSVNPNGTVLKVNRVKKGTWDVDVSMIVSGCGEVA